MKKPELTPNDEPAAKISKPREVAGGLASVYSSLKFALKEAGVYRGIKELKHINQMKGFDCPGCAWPDPDDRRELTEFCENGAKAIAEEATQKRVDAEFFKKHSVEELSRWSDFEIGKSGRLTKPMILKAGAKFYEPISWEDAFEEIARELNQLSDPNEAVFYTSGRTSNEAAFLYQLFVRLYGTNNLPDCSNMCHESSGVALKEVLGIGKGSIRLEDFNSADCILIVGQNPGTNHPRMLTALQKAARNNCKIISINPLFETGLKAFKHPQEFWRWFGRGTPIACLHLPIRVNSDMALLKGIMKELLAQEILKPGKIFDLNFIHQNCSGYEEFIESLNNTSWTVILEETGLSRENIKAAADVIAESKRMICCWAMGLTQQTAAVESIQEVVNLLLLGGHLGREGAGVCPVRGHSNVQGDRTMGIFEKPSQEFLDALKNEFDFEPPRAHGLDSVEAIKKMYSKEAKVFFALGGNFLSASPDTEYTAKALRNCNLTVQISTKLNRSHLVTGKRAIILPCLGRTEIDIQDSVAQIVSVENSMGVVHSSRGNLKPLTKLQKSEVEIVASLAHACFKNIESKNTKVNWLKLSKNYDLIRDHISHVIPGFENFNEKLKNPSGFYLPNLVRDSKSFATSNKKAQFSIHQIKEVKLKSDELILMTLRSHDQFNTTIYGLDDRYRGIKAGRRVLFLNPEDIQDLGFKAGEWVDITSHFGQEKRIAQRFMLVEYEIPRKCAATYFPEANVLVPIQSVAGKSNTPTYKSITISLKKSSHMNDRS